MSIHPISKQKRFRLPWCLYLPLYFFLLLISCSGFAGQIIPEVDLALLSQDENIVDYMLVLESDTAAEVDPLQLTGLLGWRLSTDFSSLAAPRQISTLWLQVQLTNSTQEPVERWLDVAPWRLRQVDSWLLSSDARNVLVHQRSGLDIPLEQRFNPSRRSLLPVSLDPGESARLLIRVHSDNRPYLRINSWEPVEFTRAQASQFQRHSMLLAVMLTLLVVLLLRMNSGYALIGGWMFVLFVLEAEKAGYISSLLFPAHPLYSFNLLLTASLLEKALFLAVSVVLLGLAERLYLRRLVGLAFLLVILAGCCSFFLDGVQMRYLSSAASGAALLSWLVLLPIAWQVRRKWQRTLLALLSIHGLVSLVLVLSHAFNIFHTGELIEQRLLLQVSVVLSVLLLYAWQKRGYERTLERRLRRREQAERIRLERAVAQRTEALHAALAAAENTNAAKTDFLGRIAHDLKSSLTTIMGYSQLLRGEDGSVGKMSAAIHGSATHMLNMVSRLIDYAHDVTSGGARSANLYLPAFFAALGEEAKILAARNGNGFTLAVSENIQPVIRSDQTLLREILLNLLGNAAKYTRDGHISLHVDCQPQTDQVGFVLYCCVEDNGPGIAPELRDMIFQPFFRAITVEEGFGLGLAIVQELANKLGASLELQSELGQGTRITLSLSVEQGWEDRKMAVMSMPSHLLPELDACGKLVWVIEDADAIRQLLQTELDSQGFRVACFDSAEGFIVALAETSPSHLPDLVITDHWLPGAGGDQVLAAVRQRSAEMPVISLTANWQSEPEQPNEQGYLVRLSKPVDLGRLRRELARACGLPLRENVPDPTNRRPVSPENGKPISRQQLARLKRWVVEGAVSDLLDWCTAQRSNGHLSDAVLQQLEYCVQRGDFTTISELLAQLEVAAIVQADRELV